MKILLGMLESGTFHVVPLLHTLKLLTIILYKSFGQCLMCLKNEEMVMENEDIVNRCSTFFWFRPLLSLRLLRISSSCAR